MKRTAIKTLFFLALAGGAIAAGRYALRTPPIAVEAGEVVRGPMQVSITAEGRTRLRNHFTVSSPVDGQVGRVRFKEGDRVRCGDVITWITPADLEMRTEKQRNAALLAVEAEQESTDSQLAHAQLDLEQAERELGRTEQIGRAHV